MSDIQDIINKDPSEVTLEEIAEMQAFINRVVGNVPEYYSYESILRRVLNSASDNIDKRVGSIFYDAVAPCCAEMANEYIEIQIFKDQVYVLTAIGDNLDKIGENYSIPRNPATKAVRIAEFENTEGNPLNLPLGRRFSVPDSDSTITYVITKQIEDGKAQVECEQTGTIGNEYYGAILPLFSIDNLGEATITGTQHPAQDKEDDDTYRARIIYKLRTRSFGGNIADYKDYISSINGTSEPKVFPVWNGGGTVKLSILDSQYNAISNDFISEIKELIDPTEYTGQGVGMAPIGHQVTVVTPTVVQINIYAEIQLRDDKTIGSVQDDVEEAISNYLYTIRKNWVHEEYTDVYITQIIAAILSVAGVVNVDRETLTLNGETSDIELRNTATNQYIPILGTVELVEDE